MPQKKWFRPFGHIYTLLVAVLAFVLFRADTLGQGFGLIADMFTGAVGDAAANAEIMSCLSVLFIISFVFALILSTPVFRVIKEKMSKTDHAELYSYASYAGSLAIFALCVLSLVSSAYNPFIYFRF